MVLSKGNDVGPGAAKAEPVDPAVEEKRQMSCLVAWAS